MKGWIIPPPKEPSKYREEGVQNLVLLEKCEKGVRKEVVCEVLYISLRGRYDGKERRSKRRGHIGLFLEGLL